MNEQNNSRPQPPVQQRPHISMANPAPGAPQPPASYMPRGAGAQDGQRGPDNPAVGTPANPGYHAARQQSGNNGFERTLGTTVFGVIASILVFFGVILIAALVVPQLDDLARALFMYGLSFAFVAAGIIVSEIKRTPFSIALLATGAGTVFITSLLTYALFNLFDGFVMMGAMVVWMLACLLLTWRYKSLPLSIIVHAGMIVSVVFLYTSSSFSYGMPFILGYQVIATIVVVGGGLLCYRQTYQLGLFASLGLTVFASAIMLASLSTHGTGGASASIDVAVVALSLAVQMLAASALSLLISLSTRNMGEASTRVAIHVFNKLLWLSALFVDVLQGTILVCTLFPAAMGRLGVFGSPALPSSPGSFPVDSVSLAVFLVVVCLIIHIAITLVMRAVNRLDAALTRVSTIMCVCFAGCVLLWRYTAAQLGGTDAVNLTWLIVLSVLLYAAAAVSRERAYGICGHVFLIADAYMMIVSGFAELSTKLHPVASFVYLAVLVGALFLWWRTQPQEARVANRFATLMGALVGLQFALICVCGLASPEIGGNIAAMLLLACMLAMRLLRIPERFEASAAGRSFLVVDETLFILYCCVGIGAGADVAKPPLAYAVIAVDLVIALLAAALLALRVHAMVKALAEGRGIETPSWRQAVEGIVFTALVLSTIDCVSDVFDISYVGSVACMLCAFACVGAGFGLRLRGLRLYGLIVVLGCVLKIALLDGTDVEPVARAISFIVGGLVCFGISALYSYAVRRADGSHD